MCLMLSFVLSHFCLNKKIGLFLSFYFNLSGETMALKPMWSCSLRLGTCVKGCLWEDSVLSITSDKRCTAGIRDNVSNHAGE